MCEQDYQKQQVVFAALIHHVGVFFALANDENDIEKYTQCFCDKLVEHNSALDKLTLWKQLATENTDSNLKQLIQTAHEFAISEQKETKHSHYLQSILEKVNLPKTNSETKQIRLANPNPVTQHLPLAALSLEEASIYPTKTPENKTAIQDYKNLETAFWNAFDEIPHFEQLTENTLSHLTYNLLNLFERFFSQVPALENTEKDTTSDISLFDHLRVKAAIAEGLYEFHKNDLEKADFGDEENEEKEKWSLICGDFSGIQKFIYNIVHKNAAKALRGRSLYIQLLCDAVSQHLTQQLDLFPTSQIYSSGGKFYLLIPIGKVDTLKDEVTKVNRWLLKEFRGLIFLGIGSTKVCADCFYGGNMGLKWKQANESLMDDRSQRFKALMHDDFFEPMPLYQPKNKQEKAYCEVCGRDDKEMVFANDDERHICEQCKKLEDLGKKLSNPEHYPHYFLWDWDRNLQTNLSNKDKFTFFSCDLYVVRTENIKNLHKNIKAEHKYFLEVLNQVEYVGFPEFNKEDKVENITFTHLNRSSRLIGLWDVRKQSWNYDFEEFAENSQNQQGINGGIKRMGILRMDVDNLGQVFVNGLSFKNEVDKMGSLSRVATLSRQLSLFFSGYLNKLLENYHRTQIIYAGGDDLFLIGSWDELPEVANLIRIEFSEYCAGNPNFTLSGGMAMVSGKYPISRAADLAGREETKAKKLKYTYANSQCQKNAFCFLETPIPWKMYESIESFKSLLLDIIEQSDNSQAIIGRLRDVVVAMQEFERLTDKSDKNIEEIKDLVMYQKWRWRLVYNLARMESRYPKLSKEQLQKLIDIIINNKIDNKTLLLPASHWLLLPVRWTEFLTRKGR